MGTRDNRAIALCESWQDKQRMLEEVFGKGITAELSRQKYDFFRLGIGRISKGAAPDEKLVLELVKKTVRKLEKELYPNRIIRALYQLKNLVYDLPVQSARLQKLKTANIAELSGAIGRLGFNADKLNLNQRLDFEQPRATIALVSPHGAQNYQVQLHLEKDQFSGKYQLNAYTATLKNPVNPEQSRSFTFDAGLEINAREAANLLEGRAVLKHYQIGENRMAGKWVQLDFKNLTAEGKPQLKQTGADDEYNLREEVVKVAQTLDKPELASARVLGGMEQGNQITLKHTDGRTSFLEANPLAKDVLIRNEQQQPITLDKLKKQKEAALKLIPEQLKTQVKKLKLNKKHQQDQSIGIA